MGLDLLAIFGAGVATFATPCVLPLVPIYLSALVEIGLVLFLLTIVVNLAVKMILTRFTAQSSRGRAG